MKNEERPISNKTLHLTANTLHVLAAGELGRYT
jgi:hypothetical protein